MWAVKDNGEHVNASFSVSLGCGVSVFDTRETAQEFAEYLDGDGESPDCSIEEVSIVPAAELTRLHLLDAYQKAWANAADANANHALGDCTEEEFDYANNAMKAAYDALKACDTTVKRTLVDDRELERLRLADAWAQALLKEYEEYGCLADFPASVSAHEAYRAHVAKEQTDANT